MLADVGVDCSFQLFRDTHDDGRILRPEKLGGKCPDLFVTGHGSAKKEL